MKNSVSFVSHNMNYFELFKAARDINSRNNSKGPVKLIKLIESVKIALLLSHVTSKLFQFTILNLSG